MQSPERGLSFSLPDNILQQLAEQDWVVIDSLIPENAVQEIKDLAVQKWDEDHFSPASIGRGSEKQQLRAIRGDHIAWLDPLPPILYDFVETLKKEINQKLWLGINQSEFHFARYDANSGYDEHLDQSSQKNPLLGQRIISVVFYLNKSWQKADGGELQIRNGNQLHLIEPLWGRLVLFKSDKVPHAVLASKSERWSLTGWLRKL